MKYQVRFPVLIQSVGAPEGEDESLEAYVVFTVPNAETPLQAAAQVERDLQAASRAHEGFGPRGAGPKFR